MARTISRSRTDAGATPPFHHAQDPRDPPPRPRRGPESPRDRGGHGPALHHRVRSPGPRRQGRPRLAAARRHGRRTARGPPVRQGGAAAIGEPAAARLADGPSRAAPEGRDPPAAAHGIQGAPALGLPVHPVLPPLPGVAAPSRRGHAPGAPRGREAVRRLRRADDPHHRSADRGDHGGPAVRRGARCQQRSWPAMGGRS